MKLYVIKDLQLNEYKDIELWNNESEKDLRQSFVDFMRNVLSVGTEEDTTNLTDKELFDFFGYKIVNETFDYILFDNVDEQTTYIKDFEDLKGHCDHWCERLNDERIKHNETPYHTIDTMEGIKEILECCNIDLIE